MKRTIFLKGKEGYDFACSKPFVLESLEARQLMSASAISTLGGITANFSLNGQGDLQETIGQQRLALGTVQGLYQGSDAAGDKVVYLLSNQQLEEFSPASGWMEISAASNVIQDNAQEVFFQNGSQLLEATGTLGADIALLNGVDGISLANGSAIVQVDNYFECGIRAKFNPSGNATTVTFSNVELNVAPFVAGFVGNAIEDIQEFSKPLQGLADALDNPLLNGWGFTTISLLKAMGMATAAANAQTFASLINTLNSLSAPAVAADTWLNLGSFTAQVQSPGFLKTISTSITASANQLASKISSPVALAIAQLKKIAGLQLNLTDPNQLIKLITGETPSIFSFVMNSPAISTTITQQLAAIPISPITLTELDIKASLSVSVAASATVGYDSGGFFIQAANVAASLSAGLSGVANEADLAGVQLTGAVTGSISAALQGSAGSGKYYFNQPGGIVFSNPNWHFGISVQFLNPTQMIVLDIEQYGSYLKKLLGTDIKSITRLLLGDGISLSDVVSLLDTLMAVPLPEIAALLHQLNVGVVDIAAALFQGVTSDLGKIAQALFQGVTKDLTQITEALSAADADVVAVVDGLAQFGESTAQLAKLVWTYWDNHVVNWGINELAGALSAIDGSVSDVFNALRPFASSIQQLASALWHNWHNVASWSLNTLSSLLSSIDDNVFDVVSALYQLGANAVQVANAVWHDWSSAANWGLNQLAGALSAVDDSVYDVIDALHQIDSNVSQLAYVVWHDWSSAVNWSLNTLAGALSAVDDSLGDVLNALRQFDSNIVDLARAVWNDWQNFVNWDLGQLEGVLGVASEVWNAVENAADTIWNDVVNFF